MNADAPLSANGRDGGWTAEAVAARLAEAVAALMALPVRERDWIMSCRSRWPGLPASPRRRPRAPAPGAIDRMLPTLLWIRHLDEPLQRVVWLRALGQPWPRIGAEIARSRDTARRWHDRACRQIALRLNREGIDV